MPLKSKRVASSLRAWLTALSSSCLSTSETMSNEGMKNLDTRYLMLDHESDASEPYGFASTILMSPSAARILIAACPSPLTNMSIFAAAADAVRSTARLSKSLAIVPCAVSATRWKAELLGRNPQAFPWAIFAWSENVPCSHQSYEKVRFPRCRARSILVKQLWASIRPAPNQACTLGPRMPSTRTSPATKRNCDMPAVQGSTQV